MKGWWDFRKVMACTYTMLKQMIVLIDEVSLNVPGHGWPV
jgi:hypothetical protein